MSILELLGIKRRKIVDNNDGPTLTEPVKLSGIAVIPVNAPINTGVHSSKIVPDNRRTDVNIQASSIAKFFDETFSAYKFSKYRDLYDYDEPSFYNDFETSYIQNPYTNFVIEFLMNETFANDYHFEGPGANVVDTFFKKDSTKSKIKMAWRESYKKGNSFLDLYTKNGRLTRTAVIPTEDVYISLDEEGVRHYWQGKGELNKDNLMHFMIREEPSRAYGMSLLRSNYLFLTALYDMGGDIVAAMKRTAYAPIVTKLDLEGYSEEEKPTVLNNYKARLEDIASATNNFVIDKRHEMDLLGSGGSGARLLPTNDLIEPLISVILLNFGVPLGMFLQTGANKSIMEEQRNAMNRFYEEMRGKIKYYIEQELIPKITNRDCKVVFNDPPITSDSTQRAMLTHLSMFKEGLLSREYILDYWNIDDRGTSFAPALMIQLNKSKMDDDSVDSPISKKQRELQLSESESFQEPASDSDRRRHYFQKTKDVD